jgi:hypothetical protein
MPWNNSNLNMEQNSKSKFTKRHAFLILKVAPTICIEQYQQQLLMVQQQQQQNISECTITICTAKQQQTLK